MPKGEVERFVVPLCCVVALTSEPSPCFFRWYFHREIFISFSGAVERCWALYLRSFASHSRRFTADRFHVFLPLGGSSEHRREQGHPAEGVCVQELQPAPWLTLSLPGGLPAPALAGPPGHNSSSGLLPRVYSGK